MSFLDIVNNLVDALRRSRLPHEIPVNFPEDHPLAGQPAGRYLLQESKGEVRFTWAPHPRDQAQMHQEHASLVISHSFHDLDSMVRYLGGGALSNGQMAAFVKSNADGLHVKAYSEVCPQDGCISLSIHHHPCFIRWRSAIPAFGEHVDLTHVRPCFIRWRSAIPAFGEHVDLTHVRFADLLVDNREDLHDEALAQLVATMSSATEVRYEADLDTRAGQTVSVKWKAEGSAGKLSIPRTFKANIPVYAGLYDGEAKRHTAEFRVRVMAPGARAENPAPIFRLLWVNSGEFLEEARAAALTHLRERLPIPVLHGVGSSQRFVTL